MSVALRISNGTFGRVALLDMDRSLVRHAHPHCHVLLKIDGDDTQFSVGNRVAPLTETLAVLVNAWEPHAYVHDPARRHAIILALYIEPQWLRSFRSNWTASGAPGFFASPTGAVSTRIRRTAHDLVSEMVHTDEASSTQEALLSVLMIAVIETFTPWRTVGDTLRGLARSFAADRRIRRAIDQIRADPGATPGVDALARSAGLSRAHFFRMFERTTGVTPHVFINAVKIERAVKIVATSQASLGRIGQDLGFESQAHFTRFFRDHVSVPPSDFRSIVRMRA